jgi:hypothetical protein
VLSEDDAAAVGVAEGLEVLLVDVVVEVLLLVDVMLDDVALVALVVVILLLLLLLLDDRILVWVDAPLVIKVKGVGSPGSFETGFWSVRLALQQSSGDAASVS